MRTSPSDSIAAQLSEAIDQAVGIQLQAEELDARLKAYRASIKELMTDTGIERHLSAAGNEALLIERQTLSWKLDRLQETLSRGQFDELCPRKPDAAALRGLLDSGQGPDGLRGCAKASKSVALEIRAKAAPGNPDPDTNPTNPPRAASFGSPAGDVAGKP